MKTIGLEQSQKVPEEECGLVVAVVAALAVAVTWIVVRSVVRCTAQPILKLWR